MLWMLAVLVPLPGLGLEPGEVLAVYPWLNPPIRVITDATERPILASFEWIREAVRSGMLLPLTNPQAVEQVHYHRRRSHLHLVA